MTEFMEEQIGDVRAIHGDCLAVLPTLEAESIDTIITDPPYGIFFMGKDWDHGIPGVPFWTEALRVAKPGAFLLAFGGTRTFHRLAVAIEDAGWEIRDTIMYVFGSGFPKSLDISKAIDRPAGAEREVIAPPPYSRGKAKQSYSDTRKVSYDYQPQSITAAATDSAKEWSGWGTALKPAYEPIIVAMKPLDGTFANNAIKHGVAGLNIDASRVPANGDKLDGGRISTDSDGWDRPWKHDNEAVAACKERGAVAVAKAESLGRFPANLIHDGSDEVLEGFPDRVGMSGGGATDNRKNGNERVPDFNRKPSAPFIRGDSGSAARFFYCAKASSSERGDFNTHPTVKPLALMEYLCKLTSTPTGGKVLDMFGGSFSTAVACVNTGRPCVIIEREDTAEQPFFTIGCRRVTDAVAEKNAPKPPSLSMIRKKYPSLNLSPQARARTHYLKSNPCSGPYW